MKIYPVLYPLLVVLWMVVLGPLWLAGWGVLRISRRINQIAAYWCRFLLFLYPQWRS